MAVRSYIDLFLAEMRQRKGRLAAARVALNRILAREEHEFEFVNAYDAFLLVREDRLDEAKRKFEEALSNLSKSEQENNRYISLFCEYFLSIYNETGQSALLYEQAMAAETDPFVRAFLRFPNPAKLDEFM